jgi:pimeloyl-ACP methyl ester carboxylesterase
MRLVFLHGGPGFNSFAEQAILGPLIDARGHEMVFWNEPSRLRPQGDPFEATGAFAHWLHSAEQCVLRAASSGPVYLIAHSCSVTAALEIARRHARSLAGLVLVAPGLDMFAAYCNVLRLGREDLADTLPEVASSLGECLSRTRRVIDDALREGLLLVLRDERLFGHYWADADQFRASMAAMARPDAQFDLDSFFGVLTDCGERGGSLLSTAPVTTSTLVLFGVLDRITTVADQRPVVEAAVPHADIRVLDGCSHYLHLDRPDEFVSLLERWARPSRPAPA